MVSSDLTDTLPVVTTEPGSLAAAIGIGMLIGLEREWRKSSPVGLGRAPGGLRTFILVALSGCVAMQVGGIVVLACVALILGVLVGVAYWRDDDDDPGITTEVALVLTLILGGLAVAKPALAVGVGVVVAVVLASRELVHGFVQNTITSYEMRDGLILATAALVVWPLLPDRFLDPLGAVNLRDVWMVVVLVMLMGAAGHLGSRVLGPKTGLAFAGLVSGFVSSTATIGAMGARASRQPALVDSTVAGATLSTVATFVQLGVLLAVISLPTFYALLPEVTAGASVAVIYGLVFLRVAHNGEGAVNINRSSMFSVKTALGLAAFVTVVLVVTALLNQYFGMKGVMVTAAVSGAADVHSVAASIGSLVASSILTPEAAEVSLVLAVSMNTVAKVAMAFFSGPTAFWLRVLPGLLLVVAAVWAANLWL